MAGWGGAKFFRRNRPCAPLLLCRFRLPRARALLAARARTEAFLEAGAAAGVAPLFEQRCQIIATAVSADQRFDLRGGSRWLSSLSRALLVVEEDATAGSAATAFFFADTPTSPAVRSLATPFLLTNPPAAARLAVFT